MCFNKFNEVKWFKFNYLNFVKGVCKKLLRKGWIYLFKVFNYEEESFFYRV